MSSSLSAYMFRPPPPGFPDPYDVPASPPKTVVKNATQNASSSSRIMTPTRDSSIGRDIIRDIDIDRYHERNPATTVTATVPEPEVRKPVPPPKEESIDPQTLQKQPEQVHVAAQTQEPPSAEPEPEPSVSYNTEPQDAGELEIESFETHRIDETTSAVEILVKWVNAEKTWEPEWSLQNQVPTLVYKYWDSLDGRDKATGLDVYHVFRVLERKPPRFKQKEFMYQVQWVGYRRSESSWETKSKLTLIAPEELIKFEAKNGSAPEPPKKKLKRGIARGPGRPRKRAKTDA